MDLIETAGMGAVFYGATLARYVLFAGVPYWICWVWKKRQFQPRRIQQRTPDPTRLRGEIRYSLSTALIIAITVSSTDGMPQAMCRRSRS